MCSGLMPLALTLALALALTLTLTLTLTRYDVQTSRAPTPSDFIRDLPHVRWLE